MALDVGQRYTLSIPTLDAAYTEGLDQAEVYALTAPTALASPYTAGLDQAQTYTLAVCTIDDGYGPKWMRDPNGNVLTWPDGTPMEWPL